MKGGIYMDINKDSLEVMAGLLIVWKVSLKMK